MKLLGTSPLHKPLINVTVLTIIHSVGVPQIVLPCWLDTLEFANRVEYLGIGVYGSRTAAPRVDAWELSRALIKVLGDSDEAIMMNQKAKKLAVICGKVGGRVKACEKIIEILETR
jgi:UDP:flavonoid glycosyltransferase YjiC (YdhE family)